jgi:hypothetical protein
VSALTFWKRVIVDRSDALERAVGLLRESGVEFCVVGGVAVNAYAEPVVTLDLDIVVAADEIERIVQLFAETFKVERFPHSLNISDRGSQLRIQVQTDPRYAPFAQRASERDVLGLRLPIASIEDVMQGKVWAAGDPTRRASKRQKDLADISRLLELYPHLRHQVPDEILARLI